MKKLIILSAGALLFLSYSCNGSTKGNWSDEEKTQLRSQFEKQRSQLDKIFGKENTNKWVDCAMLKMENQFENLDAADKDLKGAEKIGADCIKEVMGM
jgi:hypothetical protein